MPKFSHVVDLCAEINSDKPFEELTRAELVLAFAKRLENIAKQDLPQNSTEEFGHVETTEGEFEPTFNEEEVEEIESLDEDADEEYDDYEEDDPKTGTCPSCGGHGPVEDGCLTCPGFWYDNRCAN